MSKKTIQSMDLLYLYYFLINLARFVRLAAGHHPVLLVVTTLKKTKAIWCGANDNTTWKCVLALYSLTTTCCNLLVVKLHSYFVLHQVIQLLFV